MPFGRLSGPEGAIAARCQEREARGLPKTGGEHWQTAGVPFGAGSGWRVVSSVSRTFEDAEKSQPPERLVKAYGPKHQQYRERARWLLDQDLQRRREASAYLRDGRARRQAAEALMKEAKVPQRPRSALG